MLSEITIIPGFISDFNEGTTFFFYLSDRKHLLDISYLVESIYGVAAVLIMGPSSALLGCTRESSGFPALLSFHSASGGGPSLVAIKWFLDDGGLGGRKQDLQQAVDILIQQGPELCT
jgi:hypothetical protein